ncbi:TMEM43 family protein [Brevundimonas sp.]|uniref:TMEM43 family protein n=1 Tax=Brevundimonas sp. TaxID=1871086 RepID=UPI0025E41687|nr:TMEM43 family protein [Brevundimonas sp.]
MNDRFTETTQTGWFSRLGSAFGGVVVGLIAVIVGCALLGWNEHRAVQTERALNQGAGVVRNIGADAVDPANEGALVHVSGTTTVGGPVTDSSWPVSATALRLIRNVEMYQWRETSRSETRTRLGGGEETVTTYEYDRVWSDTPQDSSSFRHPSGHENPPFPVEPQAFTADDARLGAFWLSDEIIEQAGTAEALTFDEPTRAALEAQAGDRATVSATEIYLGTNPSSPQIGDARVSYQVVRPGELSVVGAQSGDGFIPYRADSGGQILLVADGRVPAADMFQTAQDNNRMLLWALRAGGLLVIIIGFNMIFQPLKVLADVLPPVGAIVGMGTGLISLLLGLLLGGVVIAVAWFAVRPLLSVGILTGVALLVAFLWRTGRLRLKRKREAAAAA